MIRTTNVRDGRIDLSSVKHVEEWVYRRWVRRGEPQDGDIILTREAPLGEVGMLSRSDGVFLGQRLVLYRADPAKADRKFLLHAMRSPYVQAQIHAFGSGATVEHMRVPDCSKILIPCPGVAEQRRIGAILGAFDELIEINERRIELAEDIARSLYREWFVRFRFPGHEEVTFVDSELGLVPNGWRVKRLGEVAKFLYGKSLPAKQRHPGTVAVVGSSGVVGAHNKALVQAPGLVVGRKGNVGAVWWLDRDFFPIDTTYYVESDRPVGWLYWVLLNIPFSDSHAAVPGLNRDHAESHLVVEPEEGRGDSFAPLRVH